MSTQTATAGETLSVAKTILAQLGGNRFTVMTGAKNYLGDANSLSFKLPTQANYTKDGINYVKITLSPSDTYTVEFGRVYGSKYRVISKYDGIYCDMLRDLFTDKTGLETSLGTCGR